MQSSGFLGVLGGNLVACPAICRLKDLGYRVLVVDGSSDAPARKIADKFLNVNFSKVELTSQALKGIPLVGIFSLNDFGVRSAANIAEERGLPGWSREATLRLINKVEMKMCWIRDGLPTARFTFGSKTEILAGHFPSWNDFPCIVKPSFSGGGSRGVDLVHSWSELRAFLEKNLTKFLDDFVVIEEFIAGTEHTVEVLIQEGECHLLSISDKENYTGKISIVQNLFFPGPIGHAHYKKIKNLIYAACRSLGLTNGAAHFEVILRKGEPYLLEVGGRPGGGGNFAPICELSTGYDYPGLLAQIMTGRKLHIIRATSLNLAWCYFDLPEPGIIKCIKGFEGLFQISQVVDAQMYQKIGHLSLDGVDDLARPGYVLVKAETHEQARELSIELSSRVKFDVSNSPVPRIVPTCV